MHRFLFVSLGVLTLLFLASCSVPQNAAAPPTAKVAGKVMLDGKPMASGEIQFVIPGQPPKTCSIKDGAFSGDAFTGRNKVEVVHFIDGPPSTTDPNVKTTINTVAPQFSGPDTKLAAEVPPTGVSSLEFAVTSK
ncbi:MAG TPA: hypothetical protein VFE62_06275 [Gemmataceae bacterium]|nr:hypothetical protein [Gemmataceae bacterium]